MADTADRRREPKGIPTGGRFTKGNGGSADASDLGGMDASDPEVPRASVMAAARKALVARAGRRALIFDDLDIEARVNGVERSYRLSEAPKSVVMAAASPDRRHGGTSVTGMRPTFRHSGKAEAAVGFVSERFGDGVRWADIPERHREGIVDARAERMVSIRRGIVHVNTRAEEVAQRLRDLEYARFEESARRMRDLGDAGYELDLPVGPPSAAPAPDGQAPAGAIAEGASRDSREPASSPKRRPDRPAAGPVTTRRMTDGELAAFRARRRPATGA